MVMGDHHGINFINKDIFGINFTNYTDSVLFSII